MTFLRRFDFRTDAVKQAQASAERSKRAVALLAKVDALLMQERFDALWAARFRTRKPVEQLTDAEWFAELDEVDA